MESKINKLEIKAATMAQKLDDMDSRNTSEHKEIIKKINAIADKIACYATQKELELVKSDVKDNKLETEKLKTRFLLFMGAVTVIIWILNHYGFKFFI
jgi:hypothetical protein